LEQRNARRETGLPKQGLLLHASNDDLYTHARSMCTQFDEGPEAHKREGHVARRVKMQREQQGLRLAHELASDCTTRRRLCLAAGVLLRSSGRGCKACLPWLHHVTKWRRLRHLQRVHGVRTTPAQPEKRARCASVAARVYLAATPAHSPSHCCPTLCRRDSCTLAQIRLGMPTKLMQENDPANNHWRIRQLMHTLCRPCGCAHRIAHAHRITRV